MLHIRQNAAVCVLIVGIWAGLLTINSACAAALETPDTNTEITESDVTDAVTQVKADPNLAQEKTIRKLRWLGDDKPKRKSNGLGWLGDLFAFIAQTGRLIVWLIIAVAIGLLVIAIVKIVRSIEPRSRSAPFVAPTHVRDLDIRPESLPDDIGAAALALWEQGEHRAALALLYRGLLSRLVHVHAMPIRHSSTEGDCLQLAMLRLPGERGDYVTRVIRMWQRAVYGAQEPQTSDVHALCSGFSTALSKPLANPAV